MQVKRIVMLSLLLVVVAGCAALKPWTPDYHYVPPTSGDLAQIRTSSVGLDGKFSICQDKGWVSLVGPPEEIDGKMKQRATPNVDVHADVPTLVSWRGVSSKTSHSIKSCSLTAMFTAEKDRTYDLRAVYNKARAWSFKDSTCHYEIYDITEGVDSRVKVKHVRNHTPCGHFTASATESYKENIFHMLAARTMSKMQLPWRTTVQERDELYWKSYEHIKQKFNTKIEELKGSEAMIPQ